MQNESRTCFDVITFNFDGAVVIIKFARQPYLITLNNEKVPRNFYVFLNFVNT